MKFRRGKSYKKFFNAHHLGQSVTLMALDGSVGGDGSVCEVDCHTAPEGSAPKKVWLTWIIFDVDNYSSL